MSFKTQQTTMASKMEKKVKIEIELNIKPSVKLGQKLVKSLFEFLLCSRAQIPFNFEIFKKFVEKKTLASEDENNKQDWKTENQLKIAAETYVKICTVKQVRISFKSKRSQKQKETLF